MGKRSSLKDRLSESPLVDRFLIKRAEWIFNSTNIEHYLKKDSIYLDIGSGKGHVAELIEDSMEKKGKPIKIIPIDIAYRPARKVQDRTSKKQNDRVNTKSANPTNFIIADARDLPFISEMFNGVSLFFVLHHMSKEGIFKTLKEVIRVMEKDQDSRIFILEDLVETSKDKKRTEIHDRILNVELGKEEHNYKSGQEWEEYFNNLGLEVVKKICFCSPKRLDPIDYLTRSLLGPVKHGFFVLKLKLPA